MEGLLIFLGRMSPKRKLTYFSGVILLLLISLYFGNITLGIIGLIAWYIPILGLPITIVGLVLGIKGMKSNNRGMAITGVVFCIIGLVASIINAAIGAYMGATGQHPLLQ